MYKYRPSSKYGQGLKALLKKEPMKGSSRRKLVTKNLWRPCAGVEANLKGSNGEKKIEQKQIGVSSIL